MKKLLFIVLLILSIFLVNADSNGIWHHAADIRGGLFGSDEQPISNYTFINSVYFNSGLYTKNIYSLDTLGLTFRNSLGLSLMFINNFGNVGIGTTTPQTKLDLGNNEIKLAISSSLCNLGVEGALRYNSSGKIIELCNGTEWNSISNSLGDGTGSGLNNGDLVMGLHYSQNCTDEGGEVVSDSSNNKFCKFATSNGYCPTGWNKYQQWTTTQNRQTSCVYSYKSCSGKYCGSDGYACSNRNCIGNSGFHEWANIPVETGGNSCSGYCSSCSTPVATARIIEIGCY